jgi:hypothetical protein
MLFRRNENDGKWEYFSVNEILSNNYGNISLNKKSKNESQELKDMIHTKISKISSSDSIILNGGILKLGKHDGCEQNCHYNEFADISIIRTVDNPNFIKISKFDTKEGDVVLALFSIGTKKEKMVPAKIIENKRRLFIELPWEIETGERCFVLDEQGEGLLTVSLESKGKNYIRILPKISISSWIVTVLPDCFQSDYKVEKIDDNSFLIIDNSSKDKYIGKFQQDYENEMEMISNIVLLCGLSGIVGIYPIRKVEN